ncbi:hypothetical protein HDU83_001410 [Entophlyctis luteolus]|nr:hypothetical protein HDU83_001410 [Entophlyctis luteolus]
MSGVFVRPIIEAGSSSGTGRQASGNHLRHHDAVSNDASAAVADATVVRISTDSGDEDSAQEHSAPLSTHESERVPFHRPWTEDATASGLRSRSRSPRATSRIRPGAEDDADATASATGRSAPHRPHTASNTGTALPPPAGARVVGSATGREQSVPRANRSREHSVTGHSSHGAHSGVGRDF